MKVHLGVFEFLSINFGDGFRGGDGGEMGGQFGGILRQIWQIPILVTMLPK